MKKKTVSQSIAFVLAAGAMGISGASSQESTGDRPAVLPENCEASLALAAAPPHIQEKAGLYLFEEDGFRQARESENGYVCIVNRIDAHSLRPTCFDAEGVRTIVPKILYTGERLAMGDAPADIRTDVAAGFESGAFERPARAGVAYMLSHYNRPYSGRADVMGWFPPHIMFYAPDVTNADIGFDGQAAGENWLLPFVAYQGPHGYLVVRTGEANDPAANPLAACPAWVSDNPPG